MSYPISHDEVVGYVRLRIISVVLGGISIPSYSVLDKSIDNVVSHIFVHHIHTHFFFLFVVVCLRCLIMLERGAFHCQVLKTSERGSSGRCLTRLTSTNVFCGPVDCRMTTYGFPFAIFLYEVLFRVFIALRNFQFLGCSRRGGLYNFSLGWLGSCAFDDTKSFKYWAMLSCLWLLPVNVVPSFSVAVDWDFNFLCHFSSL